MKTIKQLTQSAAFKNLQDSLNLTRENTTIDSDDSINSSYAYNYGYLKAAVESFLNEIHKNK